MLDVQAVEFIHHVRWGFLSLGIKADVWIEQSNGPALTPGHQLT
jgi:hypothetical protein